MMMISALYFYNCWIFIVLAHWNNNPREDMSFHMDTLFWFQANQSLLLFFHAGDANFIVIGLTIAGLNPRSTALDVRTLTIAPPIWFP